MRGTVHESGDNVPGQVFLVCYRDGQPVMVEPINLGKHKRHGNDEIGYSYEIYTSAISFGNGSHELFVGYQTDLNLYKKEKNLHKSVRIL